ncbi:MAG: protocatechuate 3,4-dioxygenase [Pseudomonadota bacterium]|nr:protocatechuate 3,4-dioxygenase [Pseudomonadota bacterium]
MAQIVSGFATSHGPLLILPPEDWTIRAEFDRSKDYHNFQGGRYSFDELVAKRGADSFTGHITLEARQEHFRRCQVQLDTLAAYVADLDPDVLVVVGDDQKEWFFDELQPAYTIFAGETILNSAYDPEKHRLAHKSIQMVEMHRHTPEDTYYDCVPELASHMIHKAMEAGFDVTASKTLPQGPDGPRGIGHAFSFIYRRVLCDKPIPLVPVFLNTFFPPNQPRPRRCFELGRAIGEAVKSWDSDARVCIVASGGLSHFVIDEEWDRRMLKAMQSGDVDALVNEPQEIFESGTSETKNWFAAIGALSGTGFKMDLLDYVPCYRSEAGTGNAMGFAIWD